MKIERLDRTFLKQRAVFQSHPAIHAHARCFATWNERRLAQIRSIGAFSPRKHAGVLLRAVRQQRGRSRTPHGGARGGGGSGHVFHKMKIRFEYVFPFAYKQV